MEQGEERGGSRREMGALRMGDKNMVVGGVNCNLGHTEDVIINLVPFYCTIYRNITLKCKF